MTEPGDQTPSPYGASSDAVVRAGRALGQASAMINHAVAERLGIHPTSWECLALLLEHGSMTAGRLAELTGLTTGAVTALVDRLESGGYARRQRDRTDRRKVIVELVPSALADAFPLFAPMLADMRALNSRYTDEELATIVECLAGAADILRRHALRIRSETSVSGSGGAGTPGGRSAPRRGPPSPPGPGPTVPTP